jgi:thiol-disulfide isomerase/thioredoxin
MMYKVGIVNDTDELLDDYKVRLKREAIELIVAPEGSMGDIKEWIVQEKIKSILIDYQLSSKYDFNGTELAFYLEDALQGMPYLILTSYPKDSVDEKIVVKNAICDRSIMDKTGDEFNDFCDQLKQMTEVFDNTLKKYKEKYEKILKEKQKRNLSVKEEEELMDIFRILKAYREVDEVPAEMLKSSFSGQIDLVLNQLDTLLKK